MCVATNVKNKDLYSLSPVQIITVLGCVTVNQIVLWPVLGHCIYSRGESVSQYVYALTLYADDVINTDMLETPRYEQHTYWPLLSSMLQ